MKYRVVFHLDEDDDMRVSLALNNIRNLIADLVDVEVELVAYASGVNTLRRNSGYSDTIKMLMDRGVKFAACSNTLRGMGIGPEDLLDGVEAVPSGAGEIVRRQAEGWAYLRP